MKNKNEEKKKSFEELLEEAKNKGIHYYLQLIEEDEKYELEFWKNDSSYEEMKSVIHEDHQNYRTFFNLLIVEKKEDEALKFLRKLDTRPREYIIMWLRDEQLLSKEWA